MVLEQMETETITSINDLIESYNSMKHDVTDNCFDTVHCRGQSNKDWLLSSTLERHGCSEINIKDYYRIILKNRGEIETVTNREIDMNDFDMFVKNDYCPFGMFTLGLMKYLIYLRHHKFPSPLLDWSKSPYIALYFAVSENLECDGKMFYLVHAYDDCFSGGGGIPEINYVDNYNITETRHHKQNSMYTYAYKPRDINNPSKFVSYTDNIFQKEQNIKKEFIIPAKSKKKLRDELNLMNINAYSLMGDEDSLMKDLTYKYFNNIERCVKP